MSDENAAWRFAARQYLESLVAAGVTEMPRVELPPPITQESRSNQGATSVGAQSLASQATAPSAATSSAATSSAATSSSANSSSVVAQPAPVQRTDGDRYAPRDANRSSGPTDRPARAAAVATGADVPLEATSAYPATLSLAARAEALQILSNEAAACVRCKALAPRRKHTVFGEGDPNARVCFFGEAPGEEEDLSGRPFVGPAGQLLDKIIAACGFQRSEIYILNTLKCRPPANRNPLDDELINCRAYWVRQFEVIRPEYIVCLGAFAVRSLLGSSNSIGKLRGSFHRYRDSRVVATYHPSYLLRTPSAKKLVWDDLKMMLADMGIDPKSRG